MTMAPEKAALKRALSEVEGAGPSTLEERIAEQVTENPNSSRPLSKKPRVEERRSIFVRSLPPDATNESLADFFSQYFPVKHATVITDQKTKQSRGYGFVTFADAEDAQQAKTALDKKAWDGRCIRIDTAEPRHRDGAGGKNQAPAANPGKPGKGDFQQPPKLIVRNLPWSIKTSEQLSHLFRSFGKVKFADLPKSKGKLKGFGFITIRGRKNSQKALESVNGKEIDGRTVAVDWAVDKETWNGQQQNQDGEDEDGDQLEEQTEDDDGDSDVDGGEERGDSRPKDKELDADLENFMKNHMQNMEDEDDDQDEDEEDGDIDDEDQSSPDGTRSQKTTDNSSTVFIRNLPFTATDEQLKGFFGHFGRIRYARVVIDKATDKPAGTGFVCFFKQDDAKSCIKEAPRPQQPTTAKAKPSILQDENADPEGRYTLDSRLLQVAQAVNRETAANLADASLAQRRAKDKRRLFLLSEGSIGPKSPLFKLMSESELQMRQASAAQRKKLVEKNPSLHLSLTRLAVRNIPRNIGSKELKELARKAVVEFAKDVKQGRRQPLSKEENARDGKDAKERERQRKLKGKGIVRQAKVVFESNQGSKVPEKSGAGKSRGYGFIEYTSHHWALMGLRYLNGLQLEADNGRKQRLIVEFSIENAQVVQRRKAIEGNSSQKPQAQNQESAGETVSDAEDENQRTVRVLKENTKARGKDGKKTRNGKAVAGERDDDAESDRTGVKQKLIARKRLMRKKKANARGKK